MSPDSSGRATYVKGSQTVECYEPSVYAPRGTPTARQAPARCLTVAHAPPLSNNCYAHDMSKARCAFEGRGVLRVVGQTRRHDTPKCMEDRTVPISRAFRKELLQKNNPNNKSAQSETACSREHSIKQAHQPHQVKEDQKKIFKANARPC